MNIKLTILKLLFGGVDDLIKLLQHVEAALTAESLKLHEQANELNAQADAARNTAIKAGNLAQKIGS